MTTTTIEQFRKQCAKIADDCFTDDEGSHAYNRIMALPLPVMPQQAEPDDYQKFIDSLTDDDEDKMHMQIDAWARLSFARHNNSVRGQQVTISDSKDAHIIWATLRWAEENKKPDAALLARIAELEAENAKLKEGLQFYADGSHFVMHEPDSWDTCSGEPQNFYFDELDTAMVEDGSIAKQVLAGNYSVLDDEE